MRGRRLRSIRESVFIDCLCGCLAFLAGWTFPYCASSYWCLLILRDENSHISWILTFALRIEGKWTAERQWACGAGWQGPTSVTDDQMPSKARVTNHWTQSAFLFSTLIEQLDKDVPSRPYKARVKGRCYRHLSCHHSCHQRSLTKLHQRHHPWPKSLTTSQWIS